MSRRLGLGWRLAEGAAEQPRHAHRRIVGERQAGTLCAWRCRARRRPPAAAGRTARTMAGPSSRRSASSGSSTNARPAGASRTAGP